MIHEPERQSAPLDDDPDAEVERLPGGITREALEHDEIRAAMRARHPEVALLGEAELQASLHRMLAAQPASVAGHDGIWLFAYGSLLWNPCIHVAEHRIARLHGYHRDFRLKLTYGRGSPQAPGLMLGLAPGGSCRGMALRVPGAGDALAHELMLVWRREMLTGVYVPRWITLRTHEGPVPAIAFVVNPRHRTYCGPLDEATVIELMATGHGMLGSAAEYLESTVAHLEEKGIHDRRLWRLHRGVQYRRAAVTSTD